MVPSRETPWLASPEVASDELAVRVTGETYQPFEPSGDDGDWDASGLGVVRSIETVMGTDMAVFPALSVVRKTIVCVPSDPSLSDEPFCQEPPSTRYCTPATPEVASEAVPVRTTGETYQLLDPSGEVGFPSTDRLGGVVSRRIVPLDEAGFPAISEMVAVRL
jgi:hypothetical protein